MNKYPEIDFIKDSHCGYCGAKFTEQVAWPRKCFICNNESYKNPIPIIVSIIPVAEINNRIGILIQQRNIEPQKGCWALPGGYIEHGETWQEAAVRENEEEMNFKSSVNDYTLFNIKKPSNGNMLIFCEYKFIWQDDIKKIIENFVPNDEVLALDIFYGDKELAFPSHNECTSQFLGLFK